MARRTFFSFHYKPDVQRAAVVRNSWVTQDREDAGFFDAGLWEGAKRKGDDNLKALMRDGVNNTSVVCVLNGAETCLRRWVRYEIVRGILNGNGLLTVDVHQIPDFQKTTVAQGRNPLDYLGLYKTNGSIYFAEWQYGGWHKYADYIQPVDVADLWFDAPPDNNVVQLSAHTYRYNYVAGDGYNNLGNWIEIAASAAGHGQRKWL